MAEAKIRCLKIRRGMIGEMGIFPVGPPTIERIPIQAAKATKNTPATTRHAMMVGESQANLPDPASSIEKMINVVLTSKRKAPMKST